MAQFSAEDLEKLEKGEIDLSEELDGLEVVEEEEIVSEEETDVTGKKKKEKEEEEEEDPEKLEELAGEFRYPNDPSIPVEFRGKTKEEAAAVFIALKEFSSNLLTGKKTETPKEEQPKEEDLSITEDDLLNASAASVNEKLNKLLEKKTSAFQNDYYQQTSLQHAREAKANKEVFPYFEKYEGEIMQLASRLPVKTTADPRTWKYLYDQVRTIHFDEIMEETIKTRGVTKEKEDPKTPPPTARGGRSSRVVGDKDRKGPKFSDLQKEIFRGLGVSEADAAAYASND